ncbi:MAG: hypothetical protein M3071_20260 [Actinomycetota bacterium]|nr:hypothetical protein [Actinomycetota bacterium]
MSKPFRRLIFATVVSVAGVALALTVLDHAIGSANQPGAFPAPGSCHPRGRGPFVLPDATCTPGATNPAVTQETIGQTICTPGWSESVRPPESATEPQKRLAIAAYAYYAGQSLGRYEFDHLISLSLGGALDSPKNLWPEPDYPGVPANSFYLNPKDKLESKLHTLVCDKQISLATARKLLATNWIDGYRTWIGGVTPTPAPTNPQPAPTPSCTVSASYNATYKDYDVYVHSNQADQTVTVSDSHGDSRSFHTDSSGYADVYLNVHGNPAGQKVTATVGGATCSTTL